MEEFKDGPLLTRDILMQCRGECSVLTVLRVASHQSTASHRVESEYLR